MAKGRRKVVKAHMQDKGHKNEMKVFLDAAAGRIEAPISFESIHATTMATFKILEALETNTVVTIPAC
jgi:hypothetical protein